MNENFRFTKVIAIIGSILVLIPVAAAVAFSLARLIRGGNFMIDYMLPAEVFYIILAGGALLIWAAARAHKCLKAVLCTLGGAIVLLLATIGIAMATGLNTGATPEGGWESALTVSCLIASDLAVIALGIVGIKLINAIK